MKNQFVEIPLQEYDELVKQAQVSKAFMLFLKRFTGDTSDYPISIKVDDDDIGRELLRHINKVCSAFKIQHDYIEQ
jgi:hypothetical protein